MTTVYPHVSVGRVPTDRARRYAKQFVSHWGRHAIATDADGEATTLHFAAEQRWETDRTAASFAATDSELVVVLFAVRPADLEVNRASVDDHLDRFVGRSAPLTIAWDGNA